MEAEHQRQVAELHQKLQDSEQNLVEMAEQEEGRRTHLLQQARQESAAELVTPAPDTSNLSLITNPCESCIQCGKGEVEEHTVLLTALSRDIHMVQLYRCDTLIFS